MFDVFLCALKDVRVKTTGLTEKQAYKLALELALDRYDSYLSLASCNDVYFIADAHNNSAYVCDTLTGKAVDTVYFSFNEKPLCRSGKDYNFYFPE